MNLRRAIGGFLSSFVFLIFFVYMIFGIQGIFENFFQNQDKNEFLGSISDSVQNIAPSDAVGNIIEPAAELNINAESAISVESNFQDANKIIFEKNSNMQLPIASLTKLMTAIIVLDNYNLSDSVIVDENANSQNPVSSDVKLGEVMPVENFLDIMLIESSNRSAYALSEKIGEQKFVVLMNQKAKDIGLQNTFFSDPTGLSPENISTASDLVKLAEYILKKYPKITDITREKVLYVPGFGNIKNTDELLNEIPEVVCSKTGFTGEAKGCLLLVTNNPKNNDYLINIILGADSRFSEMEKLINWSSATCK